MKRDSKKRLFWKISGFFKRKKIRRRKVRTEKKRRKEKKEIFAPILTKIKEPIISPRSENAWEAWQTFNPGVILLDKKVHFLYRAIGEDRISRLGYAASDDGFIIDERLPYPVYEHFSNQSYPEAFNFYSLASGFSFGGVEDPRPVRVNKEERIYMTYTACDEGLRVALTSIRVEDFLAKRWRWSRPKLISPPGQIHKNWVIFPEKINGQYAILHSLSPEVLIDYRQSLEFAEEEYIFSFYEAKNRNDGWEAQIRGVGPPPLKTNLGWLVFYHGIDKLDLGKYKIGVMLLDLENPRKIIYHSPYPLLEPTEVYEKNGFKPGIVYASGAIVKEGKLLIYYGAADSYVGVAFVDFEEFLEALSRGIKPKLAYKVIKRKPQ